jgi:hypothetical protein
MAHGCVGLEVKIMLDLRSHDSGPHKAKQGALRMIFNNHRNFAL